MCFLALAGLGASSGIAPGTGLMALSRATASEYVPGEVLVKFNRGADLPYRTDALKAVRGKVSERVITATMRAFGDDEGLTVIKTDRPVWEAVETIGSMPGVEYAEPNYIWRPSDNAQDPYYVNGSLWGMYGNATHPANNFGSQAGETWNTNRVGRTSIHVGIIDEGVLTTHYELSPNIWVNPFDPVDGIDNDGNGYIDDRNGWDFVSDNNSVYDGPGDDHGTHVAGTIGARGGNNAALAGMCWIVKMIVCKFLGPTGGTTLNAIRAVDYVTDLKIRHGIDIVATNNSWGGGGFSTALQDAITRAGNANILFCAAAGNGGSDFIGDNNDVIPFYPASYTNANIVSVASITSTGTRSSFSNYGATSVDIAAPGSDILSTVPSSTSTAAFAYYSGTSMATPHVTGACALWAAYHPERGTAIKTVLFTRALATASMAGITVTGARLNAGQF